LFHGQITQKYTDQPNAPENKKCSLWKVFVIKLPSLISGHLGPLLVKNAGFEGGFISKTFQGLHFLLSGSLSWSIHFWVICPWNKFEEKAQYETGISKAFWTEVKKRDKKYQCSVIIFWKIFTFYWRVHS
jgi:hypothetical protein